MLTPIVKVHCDKETGEPDGKFAPTMKLKVPQRDGVWECKMYDKTGNQFRINDPESGDHMDDILVKGSRVRCIIQCVGLWLAAGAIRPQWKLLRAEVDIPEGLNNHSFLPDSEDEGETFNDENDTSGAPKMVEDSEDETEVVENTGDAAVEVDDEPEVVVKKPAKKKRVVKKKA